MSASGYIKHSQYLANDVIITYVSIKKGIKV